MKKSIARTALGAPLLSAGLVAGGLAGVAIAGPGLAGAQEDDPATAEESVDAPEPGHLGEVFDALVSEGVITEDQATTIQDRLKEARAGIGPHDADGRGPGRLHLDVLIEVLGVTDGELLDARRDGQTLSDIATANGVDPQAVVDALVADLDEHLDAAVAEERLTRAEADERLADGTERFTDMVNGELEREPGRFGRGGPRGGADGGIEDPTEPGDA